MTLPCLKTFIKAYWLWDKAQDSSCVPLWLSPHTLDSRNTSLLFSKFYALCTELLLAPNAPPSPPGISLCCFFLQECPLWLFPSAPPCLAHMSSVHRSGARSGLPFPEVFWLLVLAWDNHSTRAHVHPGTPTPNLLASFCIGFTYFSATSQGSTAYTSLVGGTSRWNNQMKSLEYNVSKLKEISGTSLLVQWLRTCLPKQEVWVQSLVGNLKSHMPCGN